MQTRRGENAGRDGRAVPAPRPAPPPQAAASRARPGRADAKRSDAYPHASLPALYRHKIGGALVFRNREAQNGTTRRAARELSTILFFLSLFPSFRDSCDHLAIANGPAAPVASHCRDLLAAVGEEVQNSHCCAQLLQPAAGAFHRFSPALSSPVKIFEGEDHGRARAQQGPGGHQRVDRLVGRQIRVAHEGRGGPPGGKGRAQARQQGRKRAGGRLLLCRLRRIRGGRVEREKPPERE